MSIYRDDRIDATGENSIYGYIDDEILFSSNVQANNMINTSNNVVKFSESIIHDFHLEDMRKCFHLTYNEAEKKYLIQFNTEQRELNEALTQEEKDREDFSYIPTNPATIIDQDQKLKTMLHININNLTNLASIRPLFWYYWNLKIVQNTLGGNITYKNFPFQFDPETGDIYRQFEDGSIQFIIQGKKLITGVFGGDDYDPNTPMFEAFFNVSDIIFSTLADVAALEADGAETRALIASLATLLGFSLAGGAFVAGVNEIEDLIIGTQIRNKTEITDDDGFNSSQFVLEQKTDTEGALKKYISYRSAIEHLLRVENVARSTGMTNGKYTYEPIELNGAVQIPRLTIDANVTIASDFKLTQSHVPEYQHDLANKKYVDDEISGLNLTQTITNAISTNVSAELTNQTYSYWKENATTNQLEYKSKNVLVDKELRVNKYTEINDQNNTISYSNALGFLTQKLQRYFSISPAKTLTFHYTVGNVKNEQIINVLSVNPPLSNYLSRTVDNLYYSSYGSGVFKCPKMFLNYFVERKTVANSPDLTDDWNNHVVFHGDTDNSFKDIFYYNIGMFYMLNSTQTSKYSRLFTVYKGNNQKVRISIINSNSSDATQKGFRFQIIMWNEAGTISSNPALSSFYLCDNYKPYLFHFAINREKNPSNQDIPTINIYINGKYFEKIIISTTYLNTIDNVVIGTREYNIQDWYDNYYFADVYAFRSNKEPLKDTIATYIYNESLTAKTIYNNIKALNTVDLNVQGTLMSSRIYTNSLFVGGELLDLGTIGSGGGGTSIRSTNDIPEGSDNLYFKTERVNTELEKMWRREVDASGNLLYLEHRDIKIYKDKISTLSGVETISLNSQALVSNGLVTDIPNTEFYRTARFEASDDVKTITFSEDTVCDILMVGGGGGSKMNSPAGGASDMIFVTEVTFLKDITYLIIVGKGGLGDANGGDTIVMGETVRGGKAGRTSVSGASTNEPQEGRRFGLSTLSGGTLF